MFESMINFLTVQNFRNFFSAIQVEKSFSHIAESDLPEAIWRLSESMKSGFCCLQELSPSQLELDGKSVEVREMKRTGDFTPLIVIPEGFEPKIVDEVFEARVDRTEEDLNAPVEVSESESEIVRHDASTAQSARTHKT